MLFGISIGRGLGDFKGVKTPKPSESRHYFLVSQHFFCLNVHLGHVRLLIKVAVSAYSKICLVPQKAKSSYIEGHEQIKGAISTVS